VSATSGVTAAVALGSNLGDRAQHLNDAVRAISRLQGVRVVAVSRWIETEPAGDATDQGPYLNGAALLETMLDPRALLDALLAVERDHGRERPDGVRHAARTLDLDLLVHGDAVIDEPGLTVPHPRLCERAFVLGPLDEIAPDLVVPEAAPSGRGARTVHEHLRALGPWSRSATGPTRGNASG
jgi:2-amino-4-hydroxy-6-hydroxymethyldihydropteridine diphosphokinase